MGTKRPSWTIFDTVPNIKMSDRKLQPGGKISRDPSPRPAMTAQTEWERDSIREDEWRCDQDGDKRREKERYKESTEQPRGRYYDRDRGTRTRNGERDRQQETRNVRPLSNIEKENQKEGDRGFNKGDTFPRSARSHVDYKRIMSTTAMGEDREDRRQRMSEDRERDRDRPREREEYRSKTKDEGKGTRNERARYRYPEFEDRRRDVDGDDRRDRYAPRKNDIQRDMGPRKPKMSSPEQQRDRNKYWDKAQRRDGKRDTRSEGEIDERVWRKERVRDRDELIYQHSRSEGDTQSEKDRERREYRPQDRYREDRSRRDPREDRYIENRENERRTARHREGERQMKSGQDDRRHEDRDYEQRRTSDRIRETDMAGMSSQSQSNVTPRVPPRAQSSSEWRSDMDGETKVRRGQDGRDRKEKHRQREPKRDKKMWLEPQGGPANRDATLAAEELEDQETRSNSVIEGCSSEDTEGVSVDEEMEEVVQGDSEDNTEDSEGGSIPGWIQDKDRILSGEDDFVTVSSGGDDDEDREEDFKDCMEIWERYKDTDEEWTMGKEEPVDDEAITEGEERDTPPKYVFCVIGQTVPHDDNSITQAQVQNDIDQSLSHEYDEVREIETLTSGDPSAVDGVKMRSNSYNELGTMKRDSRTEKLLMQWREKNKERNEEERGNVSPIPCNPYADVPVQLPYEHIQSTLDQRNSGAMSPEEEEAIRIRMSGAWSILEEPKRHSQAPHLKWAKNVVREILGQSDEKTDNPEPEESKGERQDKENPKIKTDDGHSEPELEEHKEEPLEVEGLRGMGQSQADMHADLGTAMHDYTLTHTDTKSDTESKEEDQVIPLVQVDTEVKICDEAMQIEVEQTNNDKEAEMYLSVSNTLYKPNSCPSLNCEPESDIPETKGLVVVVSCHEEQVEEDREDTVLVIEEENTEGKDDVDKRRVGGAALVFGSHRRKGGFRRTTHRRKEGPVKEEDEEQEEGVGRDRRTRIFSTSDDEDIRSKSLGEVDLRSVLNSIGRKKRSSKFFIPDEAQLYQQYSEAAQNFEILRQSRSDVVSVCEGSTSSPISSPPPARRPLPPLPLVPHPHSLSHTGSFASVQSLPLPRPQWRQHRGSSPQLSSSLTQSATLWRDLPAVRNSPELQKLTEDQRRLQEVRFEVVTSEASYCRSLDIVVEHFVKSKQLGALLTTQDRNWLFSRLADVRAISHSFLSKLEEKVESDIMNFTVCDVIARHCVTFKMVYVPYLTNQSYQDATYQRLMNENQGFRQIVEKLERSPRCQRLPLRSFLVLPFQRITRIKLLVQNIVKRTTPGTAEATQAIKALKQLERLIQESNDSITQMKSIESLVSLSAKVDFITDCRTLPLISQSRRLVREGKVTELMDFSLKETERSVYLHLFNDYLLLSLQKEGGRFTVIDHSPVSELRAENCRVKLHSLQKNLFKLHMSHNALLLRTDTQSDKLRWISALSRPHPEVDFSAAQDFPQMQCIRAFVAQQPDELSLEKADIILVHQQSSDHWVEGTRLSDRHRGWVPESHLETISIPEIRKRNLSDALRLTTATAQV